jgi:hypothetical protein
VAPWRQSQRAARSGCHGDKGRLGTDHYSPGSSTPAPQAPSAGPDETTRQLLGLIGSGPSPTLVVAISLAAASKANLMASRFSASRRSSVLASKAMRRCLAARASSSAGVRTERRRCVTICNPILDMVNAWLTPPPGFPEPEPLDCGRSSSCSSSP